MPILAGKTIIPDRDLSVSFVRAGGPGVQNVNKVSSAVQLRFDLYGTLALKPKVKERMRILAGRRLTYDGAILIIARTTRSQEQNRRDAEDRLAEMICTALIEPRIRFATKPTHASKVRRLVHKTRRSGIKKNRSSFISED